MNRTKSLVAALAALALVPGLALAAGGNKPPVVKLTSPTAGQVFMLPPSITLTATATDSNGVAKVDFYRGTTLIGTDTTAPYSVDWLNPALGTYSLTASATDTLGAVATSTAVSITVKAPTSALIQSPADGAQLYGSSVTISGVFNGDRETSIIADNGITSRMRAPATNDNSNNFSLSLPLVRGPNTVTVTAARYDQTYETHSITVIGNDSPYVAFRSPAAGSHDAPASLDLEAEALSPSGSISRVEFLIDGTLRGTDTSAPYQYTWSNPPFGSHTLTARTYDQNNVTATDTRSVTINTPNTLPNVALTAPADGAMFQNGATITLNATASDPDGSINRVEFLRNGIVIGTDSTSPYSFNWTNAQTGTYAVAARAVDNRSGTTTSATANVTVNPPNAAPSVSLDSPPNGAEFTSPASILFAASAADSDGTVMWVEFYSGGTLIASDSTAPYAFEWSAVLAGTYALRARAIDNVGAVTDSAIATVTVSDPPNELPTVSLTSPADGSSYGEHSNIPLAATATDNDGTIARVEFYAGSTLIGSVTTPPYAMNWLDVPVGNYAVTARAVDDRGGATVSAVATVTVTANAAPTVSVSVPAAEIYGPTTIKLTATAADSDGVVTKVDFYANGTLLGTDDTAPYSFDWVNGPAGAYSITASATDQDGAIGASAPVGLTIKTLALTIESPVPNQAIVGTHVVVSGTFAGPTNSGIKVNGVLATTTGARFYANVPLKAGGNALLATLSAPNGTNIQAEVIVSADAVPPFLTISTSPLEGVAPLEVRYDITNDTELPADVQMGATVFTIPPGAGAQFTVVYPAGGRIETFTASNSAGATMTESFAVVALNEAELNAMLGAVWSGMNDALVAGDKAAAMTFLTDLARARYSPTFDLLMPTYAQIAASFSPITPISASGYEAEFAVTRMIGTERELFIIAFARDKDGVWRLDSM